MVPCHKCGKTFADEVDLYKHLSKCWPEELARIQSNNFEKKDKAWREERQDKLKDIARYVWVA